MKAGITGKQMTVNCRFKHLTGLMFFPSIMKFREESGNVGNGT